ncbi:PHD finger protein 11 isoform X2 [Tupaia chinensis]|uniref:PHD finger protein 11 isoform X2 n=1 Tax=Tupaia chinensis TaxID=246437 RepID=UPI000703DC8F|nr:PHD finger protein 11 isoform X2 [Tupaia chinensis]
MAQASVLGAGGREPQPLQHSTPQPTGVFQVAEKMVKRTCALCPKDVEYSVLYFAQSENMAAHENCLLYSAALVEYEDHDPFNHDRNFDVESVKKEIQRGRNLKCTFCHKRGATVGCDLKFCRKKYHFFCAKKDHAYLHTDATQGIYRVLCQLHAPKSAIITQNAAFSGPRRKRGRKKQVSAGVYIQSPEKMPCNRSVRQGKDKPSRHTDAIVNIPFLKKCKEVGLLNDLFEHILDQLYVLQERLMDDTTSESVIEDKIQESEERRQQLKEEIERLQDLKQTLSSSQEKRDPGSSSTSASSLSS